MGNLFEFIYLKTNKRKKKFFFTQIREVAGRVCHQCISDCDYELYKTNEINAIKYFLLAVEEGNGTYLNALENPSNQQFFDPRIKMTSIQKYNGYNILETGRFCKQS